MSFTPHLFRFISSRVLLSSSPVHVSPTNFWKIHKKFSCKHIIDYLKVNESTPDSLAEALPDTQDEVLVGALHVAIPEDQWRTVRWPTLWGSTRLSPPRVGPVPWHTGPAERQPLDPSSSLSLDCHWTTTALVHAGSLNWFLVNYQPESLHRWSCLGWLHVVWKKKINSINISSNIFLLW